MASLNKVLLMGNLTREPELRYTAGSNAAVCEFGLAVNRRFVQNGQNRDETCFLDIVVWGKQAESCSRFLQKGSSVFVEGRLVFDQWVEKDTQKKRSRIRVTAERVQFMSSARHDGEGAEEFSGSDEDASYGQTSSPRQQYSRPMQQRAPYQRQQYDAPQQQSYGGDRPGAPAPHASPAPRNSAVAPQAQNDAVPAMPEEDPFEDVDDIPF